MAMIIKRGTITATPHSELYSEKGVLALEEIHGSYGFGGAWSRKLHYRYYPTEYTKEPILADFEFAAKKPEEAKAFQPYVVQTGEMPFEGDALRGRKVVLFGNTIKVSILKPTSSFPENTYFRNGENHELYYVQQGTGVMKTDFGELKFRPEVYIVVPKGTTYRIELESDNAFMMIVEAKLPVEWPEHYMNAAGQATMMAPIVETEIETPTLQDAVDESGEYPIFVSHNGGKVTKLNLNHHPFDVIGWEGALYPFVYDINSHHGIARAIHVAPPAHQTFQSGQAPTNGFAVCSFVPQPNGWDTKDVPVPYAHYNIDSDELMFFCNTSYGARKGIIQEGTLTFHPSGCPHSPHGNAAEQSLGSRGKMSQRLAVMIDTFAEDVHIAEAGWQYRDPGYATSWHRARK